MRLKNKIRFIVCFLALTWSAGHAQGFLHAEGQWIVNGRGEKITLRGMGLGGWMLQEGYMFHLSQLGQQYRIREKIEELVGKEKANQFYDAWLDNHTGKADIDSLASWGFNSVRLPMHYRLFTLPVEEEPVKGENTWLQKGFELTDRLLEWCKQNRLYLILDLHATPGGQGNDLPISDRDGTKPSLWQSTENQKKMIALWKKLASRYQNEEWIGGYDIINEPNWGFDDEKDTRGIAEKKNGPLRQLMMDITGAIREADKRHIVIIEGNGFGNNYNGILPAWDNNLVISFHKYGNFNTENSIKNFLSLRTQYNLPIWLGESGENSNTWFTEAISLAESHGIGWAWWQEKKMGINNPLEILQPEGYESLLRYWSGKGDKPSAEEAWRILQQLLQNLKAGNNIFHRDVIDAMFRQLNSAATIPFKKFVLDRSLQIDAVDFDLGRQGSAYYDLDSASYQYTPGVNTKGNRGWTYRNDGVDITTGASGPYVFSVEDGEWMQYTIDVKREGAYTVSFTTASESGKGKISLLVNDQLVIDRQLVEKTTGHPNWKESVPVKIFLKKGITKIKLLSNEGGFLLKTIHLTHD